MAKGSTNGVIRGKKGNTVFYKIKNSNNKEKQGWREYNAEVANPQTDGQMAQRVKLAAVNNLYRDLKDVIRRSIENKKYGDESRRAWLSMALGQQFNGPWIPKGYMLGLPIDGVPLSVGSLLPIEVVENTSQRLIALTSVDSVLDPAVHEGSTVGTLSSAFIAVGYQPGDQVTLVTGWVPLREAFTWKVISFYLDETSTVGINDIGITTYVVGTDSGTSRDYIDFVFDTPCDALAVIISRDGQTAGSHLRSTAYVGMTETAAANWYSQGAYELAKRSYLKTVTSNTNWPLDPEEGGGGSSSVVATTKSGIELTPRQLINVEAEPARLVSTDGERYYLIAHTDATDKWLYGQGNDGWTSSASAPSGSTNANSIDPCAPENIAGGFRDWLIAQGVPASLLVIA